MQAYIKQASGAIWGILFLMTTVLFSKIFRMKLRRKTFIASFLLGSVYALLAFMNYELGVNGGIDIYVKAILILIGNTVFFTIILSGIFTYLLTSNSIFSANHPDRSNCLWFIAIATALLLCWMPYYLACFPGNLTSDTIGEIRQQLGESPLSNHHPVIHQLMLRIGLIIGKAFGSYQLGIGILTLMQMLSVSLAFTGCLAYLRKRGINRIVLTVLFLYYAVIPVNGFYAVTLYKDVPFAIAALLLVILLTKELNGEFCTEKAKVLSVIAAAVTGFFFCTVRNNGYYAFLLGYPIVFLMNLKKDWKRLFLIGVSTLILALGYKWFLFDVMSIPKSSTGEMLPLPLQMIARVVKCDEPALDDENFVTLGEAIPDYAALSENYIPNNADPIKVAPVFNANQFDKDPVKYARSWLNIGLSHPKTYIEAFLLHTHAFWSLDETATITADIYPNEYGISHNTRFEQLRYRLIDLHVFISSLQPIAIIQSFGILIVLLLFVITLLVINNRIAELSSVFIIAFLWLTAIAGPVPLYHYVYGIAVTLPFFFVLAISNCHKEQS